jgi:hypothetical protein
VRLHLAGRWLFATVASAGLVLAVLAVVLINGVPRRRPAPPPTPTRASPSASTTPQSGTLVASVPVYYVSRGRLFREFHDLKVAPDTVPGRVAAAVTEMMRSGSAVDPDYATHWPDGIQVREVRVEGGIATVNLSAVPPNDRLATQQLVWTVAAAVADTPIGQIDGVRLQAEGAPVGEVLRAEPQADILAPVWLIEPHEGATVGRTLRVHVAGTAVEATLRLRVRSADDAVVKEETITLDRGAPERGEVTLQVTLPPGRYTVEALEPAGEASDDHTITVR